MSILREPPQKGSYKFVVRVDRDLSTTQPQVLSTYAECVQSRAVEYEGETRHLLFLRTKPAFDRALMFGWHDVTHGWFQHLEEVTAMPTTEGQRAILESLGSLGDGWHQKKAIVQNAGIPDTEWRTAIQYLEKKGLVQLNLGKRQRQKASNRAFRYQITDRGADALRA